MLDPWIIEEIFRREEERRREEGRSRLEVPQESPQYSDKEKCPQTNDDSERGVVVIDI